mgnify:CR=1 FL=1|jgi:hypothetical protein
MKKRKTCTEIPYFFTIPKRFLVQTSNRPLYKGEGGIDERVQLSSSQREAVFIDKGKKYRFFDYKGVFKMIIYYISIF